MWRAQSQYRRRFVKMINALETGYGWTSILKEEVDHYFNVLNWKKQITKTYDGVAYMTCVVREMAVRLS